MDSWRKTPHELIAHIYGPSGIFSTNVLHSRSRLPWGKQFFNACRNFLERRFRALNSSSRALLFYIWYRYRVYFFTDKWVKDQIVHGGMICWRFGAGSAKEDAETSTSSLESFNCLRILSATPATLIPKNLPDGGTALLTYIRIPRDILFVYTDVDPNVFRKLEIRHSVRIFHGRDFEGRGRDRDRPSAPRGTARVCVYGRFPNIMAARREIFGWMELQADYKEEVIVVPEHAAGNVIGRQGGRVANMQLESKARIDVQTRDERKAEPNESIKITVSGRRPARDAAKRLLQECVEHSERMREKDQIRDSIRDVRRMIMYGHEDSEEEEENVGREEEPTVEEQEKRSWSDTRPAIDEPVKIPTSPAPSLLFKPRSVLVAEARAAARGRNIGSVPSPSQWGGGPVSEPGNDGSASAVESKAPSWGQGFATWGQQPIESQPATSWGEGHSTWASAPGATDSNGTQSGRIKPEDASW
ncbi:hypothetical protein BV898_16725 [Hypsibius exemplaris]|uniref:K Homology domain-containing protein n=1 Tax=Hypsibius exemplaris TaxID=2072580 RepID=A0A9X6RLX4_HYPEX|nr:hypothetical protein BV898_16725 [Hypsibius exemplaris]